MSRARRAFGLVCPFEPMAVDCQEAYGGAEFALIHRQSGVITYGEAKFGVGG